MTTMTERQALILRVVPFEGKQTDRYNNPRNFNPLGIIQDMIADVTDAGYVVDYDVEYSGLDKAAISYTVRGSDDDPAQVAAGLDVLRARAFSSARKNRDASVQTLVAAALGLIEYITVDFLNSFGEVPIVLTDLIKSDYTPDTGGYTIMVHVEPCQGHVCKFLIDGDNEYLTEYVDGVSADPHVGLGFHPDNGVGMLPLPQPLFDHLHPGSVLSVKMTTVSIYGDNGFLLWGYQHMDMTPFDLFDLVTHKQPVHTHNDP